MIGAESSPSANAPPPWWTGAVVYQIYPRSFQDSNGDGIGDLLGVLQRVDYLCELGVDVVWLSPVYPSPQDDNGYDISDYHGVDPLFGTLKDLDEVVQALHARGIKVVMDLVVNHTSDQHPWFLESRSSMASSKRDWYWWRPRRVNTDFAGPEEPTNWASFFSGPTWTLDVATDEYYLHLFSTHQPDLNWENDEMRMAIYAMMRWWLDRGVDGFRMDVINLISKVVGADGALSDGVVTVEPYGDAGPHTFNGPRLHEFLGEMHAAVFSGRRDGLLLVGETPGTSVDVALLLTDPARQELDMVFTFEHMDVDHGPQGRFDLVPLDLCHLKEIMARWQDGLRDVGWNSLYWQNHDQPRVVSRFGDDGDYRVQSATMLATVLHLHRGTPFIYQGEELGMTNAQFSSFEQYRDIETLRYLDTAHAQGRRDDEQLLLGFSRGSRDNARTPVQWDDSPNAGFSTGTPWIDVNPNYRKINAATQRDDPHSVFSHYRRLIRLRHEDEIVKFGDFSLLLPQDPHIYAFTRTLDGIQLLVLANFTGQRREVALDEAPSEHTEVILANYPQNPDPAGRVITLRPWEAIVLRMPR